MTLPHFDLIPLLPEIIIVGVALLLLVIDMLARFRDARAQGALMAGLALAGILAASGATAAMLGSGDIVVTGVILVDDLSRYLNLAVLLAAGLGVLLAWAYVPRFSRESGSFYALMLLAVAGMMFMGKSVELITLFVSLEIFSVALYILTGFNRRQLASAEGALKYFLLGAFSSGFFLYGMALLYVATGSTRLADIAQAGGSGLLVLTGLALLLVGFFFKLAATPFHMWAPDAYQGAPTPVTGFMSVATKAAAFIALFRVLAAVPDVPAATWGWVVAVVAVLSMTWGNFAALRQTSLKRMLAYSSIAHAGYMLTGLVAGPDALNAVLYYLFAYAFMNIGAFAVASTLERTAPDAAQDAGIDAARGLFDRRPALAVAMAIFMLSLTGIPPLVGFFGKLYVFSAAVSAGWTWLAVVGMLNSVVSAYYYLRVIVVMFMAPTEEGEAARVRIPAGAAVTLAVATAGVLLMGLLAAPVFVELGRAVVALR
jgi:NADH-quinone oxidoreductase subunit N